MSPHRNLVRWARWLRSPALAATALLAIPAVTAHAENATPAQARADNGLWLIYAPPPSQRAGLCLVDTGVDLNPDTQPAVVERTAIDNGTPNDVSPASHGTILAMLAGAPLNGWGTVGVAAGAVQIVSIRILESGQSTFAFSSYAAGITRCLQLRERYDIKVINLSLGGPQAPGSQAYEDVASAVEQAENYGVAVVAAAGNDDGGPVGYPAAYPGVLSVGASDTQTGAFCAFSNRGAGLALLAPGCDLDAADPQSGTGDYDYWQGTSEASVIAAAALAALCSYDPQLAPQTASEDLQKSDRGILDITGAFQAAGLDQLISEGQAAVPHPAPAATLEDAIPASLPSASPHLTEPVAPSIPMSRPTNFPEPRVRLQHHRGRLLLELKNHPAGAQTEVRLRRHSEHLRTLVRWQSTIALPQRTSWISLRYIDPLHHTRTGQWLTLHPTVLERER
jgi:hypothetical protein